MMKKSLVCLIALLLCAGLFSCANAKDSYVSESNNGALMDGTYPMEPSETPKYGYEDSYYSEESFDSASSTPPVGDAQSMSEKIIRSVVMQAQTKEYDLVIQSIRGAVTDIGGFEESFHSTGRSYYNNGVYSRRASMTIRIPAERLDEFLGTVGDLVNVTSQNVSASNVTGEYYDVQSRISVLENERAAYEEMLKKAEDVTSLLKIKDRLYDVIEEIESYNTRLNVLDNKVAYSTVTLSLDEVVEYTPVVHTEPTFGERIKDAFVSSWQGFAKGVQNSAVRFVEAFPTLLVLAAIGTAATLILVRCHGKRKAKKANEQK